MLKINEKDITSNDIILNHVKYCVFKDGVIQKYIDEIKKEKDDNKKIEKFCINKRVLLVLGGDEEYLIYQLIEEKSDVTIYSLYYSSESLIPNLHMFYDDKEYLIKRSTNLKNIVNLIC